MTEPAPVLFAYSCTSDEPEQARTVFAESHRDAHADYVGDGEVDARDVVVRRAPHLDEHAPGPVPLRALLEDGWWFECHACGRRVSYGHDDWIEDLDPAQIAETAARNAVVRRDLAAFDAAEPAVAPAADDAVPGERRRVADEAERRRRRRHDLSSRLVPTPLSRTALRIHDQQVFCDAKCEVAHADRIADVDLAHADAETEAARRWPGAPSYESRRWPSLEPVVQFRPHGFEHPAAWHQDRDEVMVAPIDLERWDAFVQEEGL